MGEIGQAEHPETLARTAVEREMLHGLLASVYRGEPTLEWLAALRAPAMVEALAAAGVVLETGFLNATPEILIEEMAVEFSALFLGPGGHIPPYESVQVEGGGSLWGPETAAVKRYIEAAGFAYDKYYNSLPDHISMELDFMAHLCRQEARAWEADDAYRAANSLAFQHDFIERHLGTWADRFCACVVDRAELSFYREMARLTADFLSSEKEEIARRLDSAIT